MATQFDKLVTVLVYLCRHTNMYAQLRERLKKVFYPFLAKYQEKNGIDETGPPPKKAEFYDRFNVITGRLDTKTLFVAEEKNKKSILLPLQLTKSLYLNHKYPMTISEFEDLIYKSFIKSEEQQLILNDVYQKIQNDTVDPLIIVSYCLLFKKNKEFWFFTNDIFDIVDDYYNCYHTLLKLENMVPHWMDRIIKAIILYFHLYYYYLTVNDASVTVNQRLVENKEDLLNMGLIGPGFGNLTCTLEYLFGKSKTLQNHALYHDVFGRLYNKYQLGPGYTYCLKFRSCLKKWPLIGHIGGLFCNFFNLTSKIYI